MTMADTIADPKLKAARAEIEAVFKKYDIAGFVALHAPDRGEVFWNIWPSYSILRGDFPTIRIKSLVENYKGDTDRQQYDQAQTAQMINTLGINMGQASMQFLELSSVLDAKLGTTHTDEGFEPTPK
jgi:hypothetical protein